MYAGKQPEHTSILGAQIDRMRQRSRQMPPRLVAVSGLFPPVQIGTTGEPVSIIDSAADAVVLSAVLGLIFGIWRVLT